MKTISLLWKAIRGPSTVALLLAAVGCTTYGSREVRVSLTTSPPITRPVPAAYLVPIEKWADIVSRQGYDFSEGRVPTQSFVPTDRHEFASNLEKWRVTDGSLASPPLTTHVMPFRTIYVVGIKDHYYWTEIAPTFDSENRFTIGVDPDAGIEQ
jgi:hypothetical protein